MFDRLGPKFAQASGHRLNALYDSMSGIAARVAAREAFDVLVMPVPLIEAYVKDGVVRAQGRAALANIGLAVGVKAGRALPDVSSPEALRQTLAAARSLVHAPPSATPSGAQSDKVIRQLGLADALAGRVTHKVGLAGGLAMIASGEAELGIFPKSEIVSTAGVALAGPLPAELQLIITYGAGVVAASPAGGGGGRLHPLRGGAGKPGAVDRLRLRPAARPDAHVRLMLPSPPKRPTSALAPIASTNSTISSAYMRGMSKVDVGVDDQEADALVRQLGLGEQRADDRDAEAEPHAVDDRMRASPADRSWSPSARC